MLCLRFPLQAERARGRRAALHRHPEPTDHGNLTQVLPALHGPGGEGVRHQRRVEIGKCSQRIQDTKQNRTCEHREAGGLLHLAAPEQGLPGDGERRIHDSRPAGQPVPRGKVTRAASQVSHSAGAEGRSVHARPGD